MKVDTGKNAEILIVHRASFEQRPDAKREGAGEGGERESLM